MSERVLITGGAGFIGSNLVAALVGRGSEVVVLDDFSTGRRENLTPFGDDVRVVEGSILDPARLEAAVAGCRYVLHLAAMVAVPESIRDPLGCHEANATGTLRVLEAARRAGVERVIYASSCALYGDEPSLPKRETSPLDPLSPYAVAKYCGELYGAMATRTLGLDVVSLRFFNVFGPRQNPCGGYAAVIPLFIARALAGETLTIDGNGEQTRDFVYVDNVVAAHLAALVAPDAPGRVFNVGTGVETSVNDLVAAIEAAVGRPVARVHGAVRVGDVARSVADISAAREILGYDPAIDLTTGLVEALAYYRERP